MVEQVCTFCFCSVVVRRRFILSESKVISCLTIISIRSFANIDMLISPTWAAHSSFLATIMITVLRSLSSWILYCVNMFMGLHPAMERSCNFEFFTGSKHSVPVFSYSLKTHQVSKQVTMKDFWLGFQVIFCKHAFSKARTLEAFASL